MFGNIRGGMQVVVQSENHKTTLKEIRATLEMLTAQDWVREKCTQQASRLLDLEYLGDTTLTPSQARYLLNLLCPCTPTSGMTTADKPMPLHAMESTEAVAYVLKNLDQWTLCNSLIHIRLHIVQTATTHTKFNLLDDLASQVIQVFEDSCGNEWLGQIENSSENSDGAYSPSVWLVTPLISKLHQAVLGRVLKCAGQVLGQGQWWNPDKNQEKRRSTRATSGVAPPKTGLQWQQPFLELVLACMNAQTTTHEELLGPLRVQLQGFLAAFDKEGMPTDEQSKSMLYAALKLRLSLVGSMLATICSNEATTLDWTTLLMQLVCSGAVDRQTDSSELFTNCLDMLATLLHSLPTDFHICLAGSGEEGKKAHTACIKRLKSELGSAKSACLPEIQQLFPLAQRPFEVITVKPPAFNVPKTTGDKIVGLRIQDSREISPWDILEGIKNSGPLMLSWFGAVRMKRKPLKYIEQRRLVHFHTHQKRFGEMIEKRHYVSLPDPVPLADQGMSNIAPDAPAPLDTPTAVASKLQGSITAQPQEPSQRPTDPSTGNSSVPNVVPKPHPPVAPIPQGNFGPRHMLRLSQPPWPVGTPVQPTYNNQRKHLILKKIQRDQIEHEHQRRIVTSFPMQRPSPYPNTMMAQMHTQRPNQMASYNPGMTQMQRNQRLQMQMQMLTPEQRQLYIQRLRMRQQQAAAMNPQMMGGPQYNPQYQQQMGHPQMVQSMQAAPPMQVQQPMQHGYNQQMMVRQQFPQQPGAPMNPMQRPMY